MSSAAGLSRAPASAPPLSISDGGHGHAPPVVLLHGLGGTLDTWQEALEHLRRTRRAIAFEARGHGDSPRASPVGYTIDGWTDDLLTIFQALQLESAVLVGHSFAGTVLQTFAARHPHRVAGLVFVDAIGDFRKAGTRAQLEAFIAADAHLANDAAGQRTVFGQILGPKAKPSTRERTLASLARFDPAAWVPLRADLLRFTPTAELRQVPVLAIEAGDEGDVLFSKLMPTAPRKELPGCSHWLMLDDPPAFASALDEFLRGLPT